MYICSKCGKYNMCNEINKYMYVNMCVRGFYLSYTVIVQPHVTQRVKVIITELFCVHAICFSCLFVDKAFYLFSHPPLRRIRRCYKSSLAFWSHFISFEFICRTL